MMNSMGSPMGNVPPSMPNSLATPILPAPGTGRKIGGRDPHLQHQVQQVQQQQAQSQAQLLLQQNALRSQQLTAQQPPPISIPPSSSPPLNVPQPRDFQPTSKPTLGKKTAEVCKEEVRRAIGNSRPLRQAKPKTPGPLINLRHLHKPL